MVNEFVWELPEFVTKKEQFLRDVMHIGQFEEIYLEIADIAYEYYCNDPKGFKADNWKLRLGYEGPSYMIYSPMFRFIANFE